MKNILFIALVCFTFAGYAAPGQPLPICEQLESYKKVTLKAGSIILLDLNEVVSTDQGSVGKTILFKVKQNVMAESEVAVTTGALAMGRIKFIGESTYNDKAEIRIELLYVQAVDGQQVALNGNELTVFGEDSGRGNNSVVIYASNITANVTNNIDIKI
jgi:hypothetical protein